MVLLNPLSDTGEVVLIEESHAVGLQRMAEIDCGNGEEFSIGVVQQQGDRSVVAILGLLEGAEFYLDRYGICRKITTSNTENVRAYSPGKTLGLLYLLNPKGF